jgi:nickel-dependent lactate racemase
VKITLNYGRKGLALSLPDDLDIKLIEKKPMPVLPDPRAGLEKALSEPFDAASLEKEAESKKSACILICDITRPVPNGLILEPVIKKLLSAGMDPENITVLVATGLHRPNLGKELQELVGSDWVFKNVKVKNHYAKKDEDHVFLGNSHSGGKILLDRRFVEADLKLATGLVEPHFMAGYSGGRKVIVPGVCHKDTIGHIHTAAFLENSKAANCVLKGNPLHEEQLDIVGRLGKVLSVNVVIDDKRRPCFFSYGEIKESHLKAVSFIRQYTEIPLPKKYRTVITSSAGYPLDSTYYQTVKGMVGAMDALAPGGRMFIASACSEGIGSDDYKDAQKRLVKMGPEAFLKSLLPKDKADIDEWQTEMQVKAMRAGGIYLFTEGLANKDHELTGVNRVTDLSAEISSWIDEINDREVVVIPEGPYVMPRPPEACGAS